MSASASEKTYEFTVGMTCDGCKGAVTRILSKVEGVSKFECDVPKKIVTVTGSVAPEVVLEKLEKWGKAGNKEVKFNRQL